MSTGQLAFNIHAFCFGQVPFFSSALAAKTKKGSVGLPVREPRAI
jgi:hypothetical protein